MQFWAILTTYPKYAYGKKSLDTKTSDTLLESTPFEKPIKYLNQRVSYFLTQFWC